ncbi:conserved hypothetical protein [Streptomyces viridosporus ATCC 14672]|uniref:DUF4232 domain-containing protein n=1 Tax=Streptomyces viridosporus (strain ATCC 14672 / DSM 40746 / JCM 4963 / KCTC 9882 / NRRL B-12104 / FH 1290) TaxID=566461 RepID=D6A7N9_STRV1|nr:DUF4232 domain-containing protein [Streptomyces viridosporus]EFE67969.1 conserved hypothetical protein [Streptomyces viridosporus ATCC 14672]
MRATPTAVSALAALLLLTACSDTGDDGKRESTACSLDEVSVEVGPASAAPAVGDTGEVPVGLTNRGATCTLEGFPEVRLAGPGGSALDLPPTEGATAQKLTLAEGDSASFGITYVRGPRGDGAFDAETLRVVLPGDPGTSSFRWSYGPVASDGEGGHQASVSAYQQAGD